jgi:hypothetical protein
MFGSLRGFSGRYIPFKLPHNLRSPLRGQSQATFGGHAAGEKTAQRLTKSLFGRPRRL